MDTQIQLGDIPSDKLVERYVKVRDSRDELKVAHDAQIAPYEEALAILAEQLDARMVADGAKSIKTAAGTASRVVTATAMCEDWGAFEDWAIKNKRLDGFARRLNSAPFKEMLEDGGELPPGVRIQQAARVQVRRAGKV